MLYIKRKVDKMRYTFEIDGILVNPELPEDFDFTPNEERQRRIIRVVG